MIFVFGGADQGKREFAESTFSLREGDDRLIDNLDEWIRSLVDDGIDVEPAVDALIMDLEKRDAELDGQEVVVIMNDISQGIVPMDPVERAFREANGRAMIKLAANASAVYRVFCGIGTRIK